MWKWKEEEKPFTPSASPSPAPQPASAAGAPVQSSRIDARPPEITGSRPAPVPESAYIGKSVIIKGEVSGSEDLYVDGELQGTIELRGHTLTVGPNGRVRAGINARNIVVHGKVDGNVRASDRTELKKTAVVVGDVATRRLAIEDGAFLKGGIETVKEPTKEVQEPPKESKPEKRDAASVTAAPASVPQAVSVQGSLLETVKK